MEMKRTDTLGGAIAICLVSLAVPAPVPGLAGEARARCAGRTHLTPDAVEARLQRARGRARAWLGSRPALGPAVEP